MDPKTYRNTSLDLLHPICRSRFKDLETALKIAYMDKKTRSMFLVFESYRHPLRQQWLKDTTQNTKASAFQSSHNFGLACDFVAFDMTTNKWSWDDGEDWEFLKRTAMQHGLIVPIAWDRPHVEHPIWADVWQVLKVNAPPSKKQVAETEAIFREHGIG